MKKSLSNGHKKKGSLCQRLKGTFFFIVVLDKSYWLIHVLTAEVCLEMYNTTWWSGGNHCWATQGSKLGVTALFWFSSFSKHWRFTHGPSFSQLITHNFSYPFLDATMCTLIFVHRVWRMTTNIQEESGTKCITIYEDNSLGIEKNLDYSSFKFVHGEQTLRVCDDTFHLLFTQLHFVLESNKQDFVENFVHWSVNGKLNSKRPSIEY